MPNLLQELLNLTEDDEDITSGVKKLAGAAKAGYDDAKKRRKDAEAEAKSKQAEAEKKAKEAVNAENKIKKAAEAEAKKAAKSAAADHKVKSAEGLSNLRKDLEDFTTQFFERFPYDIDQGQHEKFLSMYPTREVALTSFKAFRDFAKRLDQLLNAMNKALLDRGKITKEQASDYHNLAEDAKDGKVAPSKALIQFARGEAKFFKRLITVTDDFKLDDADFKQLLALKMNQTNAERVPDAAEALNRLLGFMIGKLNARARIIADIGRTLDDEKTTTAKATRDGAASAAAAEDEAIAKTNGT